MLIHKQRMNDEHACFGVLAGIVCLLSGMQGIFLYI